MTEARGDELLDLCATLGGDRSDAGADAEGHAWRREAIRRVVRAHVAELRECYLDKVAPPRPAGKLVLQWTIGAGGAVGKVETVTTPAGFKQAVTECVEASIKRWNFAQVSNVCVKYPFVFQEQLKPSDAGFPATYSESSDLGR